MSVADRRRQGGGGAVETSLSSLSISKDGSTQNPQGKHQKRQPADVADSWEDEAADSDGSQPTTPTGPATAGIAGSGGAHAPPPTPSSPSFANPYALPAEFPAATARDQRRDAETRPEKTMSTASRMIAGALGVRAPRKGEEMRQYEAAAVEKERARREKEKKEREDEERRKRDVWDQ